jgi:hypothetical protein
MATKVAAKTVDQTGSLYERDSYSWALEQARALREHRLAGLDWDNLAEEIEDLAGRHRDALRSHYEVLLEHLLKLAYSSATARRNNSRACRLHARNARMRIADLLAEKPGLSSVNQEVFSKAWRYARNNAMAVLDLPEEAIPQHCPWSLPEVSDASFWPQK